MDILLIGGLWLDGSAWNDVVPELAALGHRAVVITNTAATLDEQLAEVVAAVDAADDAALVVGHSAACTLAWLAADARPTQVAKLALIGGFPSSDGKLFADFFEIKDGVMPFPGWEPFEEDNSAADLDAPARRAFEATAAPVPEAVAHGVVRLSDERRYEVPVAVVCPEFSVAQAQDWIAEGLVPQLSKAKHVEFVDIDSGHWPMLTKPAELARILAALANADAVTDVDPDTDARTQ
ncbi:alpha/beta hydrolase [Actinospica sp.]|jgi:pimeloyl-ACP methyl ester carboxylesterase|uniref:alpha/beta fold hydrolase n=1 Tax=Actinospica sp. TaxID=1872142 RepID=UPI002BA2914A|nr:alpha/beta hydrolase [Actinospica sp.]HWG25816.1 alpha/beta hydrolase [Actinospica sp.]